MNKFMKLCSILSLGILIFVGCSGSEEVNVEKIAKEFINEIYTVDSKKIDKYNVLMKTDNTQSSAETMQ